MRYRPEIVTRHRNIEAQRYRAELRERFIELFEVCHACAGEGCKSCLHTGESKFRDVTKYQEGQTWL